MGTSGSKPKRSFGDILRTILFVIALAGFLGSGGYLLNREMQDRASQNDLEKVSQFYEAKEVETAEGGIWSGIAVEEETVQRDSENRLVAFTELVEKYPDTIGWITVPNTDINYIVVQDKDGKNNDYYLKHDFEGDSNRNGAIFGDYRLNIEYGVKQPNIVIYGHHMKSGLMFNNLIRYDELAFYKQNPVISFDTIYDEGQWVIFAILKIDAKENNGTPSFNFMKLGDALEDPLNFQAFINDIRAHSVIDTTAAIAVTTDDELLTLSTCSYEHDDYRTVVVARKVRANESIDVSEVNWAADPIMPKSWGKWKGSL